MANFNHSKPESSRCLRDALTVSILLNQIDIHLRLIFRKRPRIVFDENAKTTFVSTLPNARSSNRWFMFVKELNNQGLGRNLKTTVEQLSFPDDM